MTGSSGCLALRMNVTQLCLPRTWLDSMIAVRNEKDSAMMATRNTVPVVGPPEHRTRHRSDTVRRPD